MKTARIHNRPPGLETAIRGGLRAFFVALALTVTGMAPAWSSDLDHERARAAMRAGEVMPLRTVLSVAHDEFHGDMVEAELERKGPLWVYEITMLTPGGTVLKLYYNAAQGKLLRARGHDLPRWYRGDPAVLDAIMAEHRERMHERFLDRRDEMGGSHRRGDRDDRPDADRPYRDGPPDGALPPDRRPME